VIAEIENSRFRSPRKSDNNLIDCAALCKFCELINSANYETSLDIAGDTYFAVVKYPDDGNTGFSLGKKTTDDMVPVPSGAKHRDTTAQTTGSNPASSQEIHQQTR
jgi:hypothetical protein